MSYIFFLGGGYIFIRWIISNFDAKIVDISFIREIFTGNLLHNNKF